ncbi:MAG: NAD(P)/FAD-dependent oxidoreductase [Pseudomonadota bacterium]
MTRRSTLAGMAALGAAGASTVFATGSRAALPTNADAVVVGAGVAGLAAAARLQKRGKKVVVVEAADRIGGRAYTESTTFGVPFDHGCSWINAGKKNPLRQIALDADFDLLNHSNATTAHFVDGRRATAAERRANDKGWDQVVDAIEKAGKAGKDVSAASIMPKDAPHIGSAMTWTGPMDHGVDFADLSTLDYWESVESHPQYLVREGLGAVVAHQWRDLPVMLNTAVTAIDWSGQGVSVETTRGTLKARAALVTVSTGVINSGAIRFTPALPAWKAQAFDDVPMGLLVKVPLQFKGTKLGLSSNGWVDYAVPPTMPARACYFVSWPFGYDYSVGFVGGALGWDLSRAGPEAAVDFALSELVNLVGSDARKHFVKGIMSDWATNPLTMGAYGSARPGRFAARADLMRPLGDRIFFAGEAMGVPHHALISGAYKSGRKAAKALSEAIV